MIDETGIKAFIYVAVLVALEVLVFLILWIRDEMNGKRHFITTSEQGRSNMWDRLFGLRRLPVAAPMPRHADINGRDMFIYDLILRDLTQAQRDRFAAYKSRITGDDYHLVKSDFDHPNAHYPIAARGCQVETVYNEDETAVSSRRPFFVGLWERMAPKLSIYG